jgi:hypothetical protein
MARASRVSKKSPAQIAAGHAFAAGGRAAQAAAMASPRTAKAAHAKASASARKAAVTRKRNAALRKAGKVVPAQKAKRAAVAPDAARPGLVPGFNDLYPTCSAVAVASHLFAASGIMMPDEEIWHLHRLAGGTADDGVPIEDVLEAAREYPVRGTALQARLRSFFRTDLNVIAPGLIVGISLPHDGHAVVTQPGGMVSWGWLLPLNGEPEEAWALEWEVLAQAETGG